MGTINGASTARPAATDETVGPSATPIATPVDDG